MITANTTVIAHTVQNIVTVVAARNHNFIEVVIKTISFVAFNFDNCDILIVSVVFTTITITDSFSFQISFKYQFE